MTDFHGDFKRLMEGVRNGSEDAARELVATYGDHLRRAVRRVLNPKLRSKFDSIDFTQLVWKSFFCTEPAAWQFCSAAQLAAFLVAMARRKVGAEARKRKSAKYDVGRERPLAGLADAAGRAKGRQEPLPIDVAIARERWGRLLDGQPEHYRKILYLKLCGRSCSSIGAELDLDEHTVRNFLNKLLLNGQSWSIAAMHGAKRVD